MSKRISQADDSREELKDKETPEEEKKQPSSTHPEFPENYTNPFNDKDQLAANGYPYSFSDIDFELKRNPRYFSGFEKIHMSEEELQTESKSDVARIFQYNRWKTWKYLEELPKKTVVMIKGESEEEFAYGTVSINAVTYYIMKGIEVEVPSDVKDMILVSQKQTGSAGRKDLITSLSQKLDPITGLPKDPTRLDR